MDPNWLRRLLDSVLANGPWGVVALALVVVLVALLSGVGADTIISLAVLLLVVALLMYLAARPTRQRKQTPRSGRDRGRAGESDADDDTGPTDASA